MKVKASPLEGFHHTCFLLHPQIFSGKKKMRHSSLSPPGVEMRGARQGTTEHHREDNRRTELMKKGRRSESTEERAKRLAGETIRFNPLVHDHRPVVLHITVLNIHQDTRQPSSQRARHCIWIVSIQGDH